MHLRIAAVLALLLAPLGLAAPAAEPNVVAVMACDPYRDLKKQLNWIGTLVDVPMLDAVAETQLMVATQFKGLVGLDTTRPAGLVVTAAGDTPVVHAYVPVKDLDALLDVLQGSVGPVEKVDGVRRISPPGLGPLDIVEQDGWAIIGPQGADAAVADPAALFAPVVDRFTVGLQASPGRMGDATWRMVQDLVAGMFVQPVAGAPAGESGLGGLAGNLRNAESFVFGLAVDMEGERVSLDSESRMPPESPAAGALTAMARGATTVSSPPTADGKPHALTMHLAMALPEASRQAALDGLAMFDPPPGAPSRMVTLLSLTRAALAAMTEAGGYDAALSIDSAGVVEGARKAFPEVTAGMRVADGAKFEEAVKKIVSAAAGEDFLRVTLDSGKAAGANLHTISVLNFGFPGVDGAEDTLDVTLACAPNYAYLLAGGDVPKRLAAVAASSGKPDAAVKPMADLTLAMGPLMRWFGYMETESSPAEAAGFAAAADFADGQKSALVRMLARPIERGVSMQLTADAGAIRTVTASTRPPGAAAPAFPATGGPDPIPFPVPVR